MGMITDLHNRRIYLDTDVFIYGLEALVPWKDIAQSILSLVEIGSCTAITSEMALAECLVKPYQLGQHENIQIYQQTIHSTAFLEVVPIHRKILIEAARIRAQTGHKMPDAIHIATALLYGCSIFISNDQRLKALKYFTAIPLSEFTL